MGVNNITLLLVLAGAVMMAVSIKKFISVIKLSNKILPEIDHKIRFLSKWNLALMSIFFLGYLVVFFSIYNQIKLVGNFFVGIIFFLGAVFILIEIVFQSDMLNSIQRQTKRLVQKNHQLIRTQSVTTFALAYQAELRDQETGKHLERTTTYVQLIAKELSKLSKYNDYITEDYIADLLKAAPLHDIGKVGIPDAILLKPGKLSDEEFQIIKKHCEYGADVLKIADKKLGFYSFLKIAIQVVLFHHEKWNGKGYPRGLKRDKIPLSARIMAIADVYDALRSQRCYKKAFSHEKTVKIIMAEKGEHFDPDIVDAFLKNEKLFFEVSQTFKD